MSISADTTAAFRRPHCAAAAAAADRVRVTSQSLERATPYPDAPSRNIAPPDDTTGLQVSSAVQARRPHPGEDRQVRGHQGSRARQHRHRLPLSRRLLRPRRRHQGLQHGRRRRRGARAHRPQDVPLRGAPGRHAAAPAHPADLRRRRGERPLLHRHRARARRAHARRLIHRDIKPSNIMLTQDSDVRIIDFGIALVSDSDISRIEGIAGSPSYMSPEQVQSLDLTNRSDLYSLGAVMYELLTGSRPFRAGNLQKLLHQIVYATPPPIHTLRKDIPEELENVVAVALQKDQAKRYKSGLDLAA